LRDAAGARATTGWAVQARERHPEDSRDGPQGVRTLRDFRKSVGESTHRKVASCALRGQRPVSDLTSHPGSRPPRPAL